MIDDVSAILGEKVLFMARYGSFNYNTFDEDSDKDWRGFIKDHDADTITLEYEGNDICINGIDQLEQMLVSMHPKGIELLFSEQVLVNQTGPKSEIAALYSMRNDIVAMNTQQMYIRYTQEYGLHRYLIRETNYPHLIPKYYAHAYRLLDILERFHKTNFTNFWYAIRYENQEISRHFIMGAAKGNVPIAVLEKKLDKKFEKIEKLREDFERERDHNTIDKLGRLLKNMMEVA